jgi:hypothetical protein
MKLLGKFVCAGTLLFLFYAAPAFAQFEINPDHFDNTVNQAPPKSSIASKRNTPRQHLGAQTAASQQSQARKSEVQPGRTSSSENAQAAIVQRHSHARKVPQSAKASAQAQQQRQTAQVAQVPRE